MTSRIYLLAEPVSPAWPPCAFSSSLVPTTSCVSVSICSRSKLAKKLRYKYILLIIKHNKTWLTSLFHFILSDDFHFQVARTAWWKYLHLTMWLILKYDKLKSIMTTWLKVAVQYNYQYNLSLFHKEVIKSIEVYELTIRC